MPPLVSIIIPVHNQVDYLKACLKSVEKSETDITFEIIVIDDESSEENATELDQIPNIRLLRNLKNLGFLRSCNRAALNANGQYIAFLNSDTQVTDRWIDELLDVYNRFENVGIVGSKLLYPDGTLQECGGIIWKDASGQNFGRNAVNHYKSEYSYTKETDYVSAASLVIEKSLFVEVGLFDYMYSPAYYEDTDLAFKVRAHGKRVFVEPNSIVIHHEGVSCGTSIDSGIKKHQEHNRLKFLKKWKCTLNQEHFPAGENVYEARDRSRFRERILVIDHYVPTFDRDAGSRCIFLYLKLLIDLGYLVTFLPNNFHNPQPYTKELNKLGIEVLYGPSKMKNTEEWLREHLCHFKKVFISRPNIAVKYLDTIKKYSESKIVFFGHDIHHLRLERELVLNSSILPESIEIAKQEELTTWQQSDIMLYPSQEEVDYVEQKQPQKLILEVPIYFYKTPEIRSLKSFQQRDGILFVANFNHPPNKDGIHWFFSDVYLRILEAIPTLRIHIIGSAMPEEIQEYRSETIQISNNVSDQHLQTAYQNSRIAIAPLRFGAGVKGKVLESLYHQLPIVTTHYGAQGIPKLDQCAGVTDDSNEFANLCVSYYSNEQSWNTAHSNSLPVLLEKFSYKNAKEKLQLALS